jgi:hypothetical protein
MGKPTKTEAELIAMAGEELKAHLDCPGGIVISVLRDGDSWEFRTQADQATIAKPGYAECVAMLAQIGDHLSKQYDVGRVCVPDAVQRSSRCSAEPGPYQTRA